MPGTRKDVDPLSSLVSKPEASRPAPPRAPTPAELARILAKAAVAKAGAGRPAAPTAPAAPAAPAAAPAPAPRPVGIAGAPPPRRSMSAAEAMDAARHAEEDRAAAQTHVVAAPPAAEPRVAAPWAPPPPVAAEGPTRPAPTARTALTDPVQAILASALSGTTLFVAGAYYAEDRKILTALWKAHRANFGARMQLDQAVACETVLVALQTAPPQRLAAAHVLSDRTDFLLWVDLQNRKLLAAFPNARTLIAGLQGA